jgi:hypothetical protein
LEREVPGGARGSATGPKESDKNLRPRKTQSYVAVFLCAVVMGTVFAPDVFAQVRSQAAGLFWIDVPQQWQWFEDADSVTLMSPSGYQAVRIDFKVVDGIHDASQAQELVRRTMASQIQEKAFLNGKPVLKVERKIGGVFALQTGFIVSTPHGMKQATAIVFFRDRRLFQVTFEAPREFLRLEMEKIVDTITFEAPPQEDKEASGALDVPQGEL